MLINLWYRFSNIIKVDFDKFLIFRNNELIKLDKMTTALGYPETNKVVISKGIAREVHIFLPDKNSYNQIICLFREQSNLKVKEIVFKDFF